MSSDAPPLEPPPRDGEGEGEEVEATSSHVENASCDDSAQLAAQLEEVRSRLKQQTQVAEAVAHAGERALRDLRQKLATQTQQLKEKDTEIQRLQQRLLQGFAPRDAAQKAREELIFQELHRRAPRAHSAADSRTVELIEVYEARRRAMQADIDELRAANQKLASDLCDKENYIAQTKKVQSQSLPDDGKVPLKVDEEQQRSEAVAQAECRAAEMLRDAHEAEREARAEADKERARATALEEELRQRPTLQQWEGAKAAIEGLQAALPPMGACATARVAQESAPARAMLNSSDAIRRDRKIHRLELHSLCAMPASTMLAVLQDCCCELELKSAQLLPAALRKMCRALAALPPMEAFIREVCALATSRSTRADASGSRVPPTKVVMQLLQGWVRELQELDQMRDLIAVLSALLRKRAPMRCASHPSSMASATTPLTPRAMVEAVEDLLQQERKAQRAVDSCADGDLLAHGQADEPFSKLFAHFARLFSIKSTEGMLPKMNELYLFVNEQQNLNKVIRSMVGVEPSASAHRLLSALHEALDEGRMHETASSEAVAEASENVGAELIEGASESANADADPIVIKGPGADKVEGCLEVSGSETLQPSGVAVAAASADPNTDDGLEACGGENVKPSGNASAEASLDSDESDALEASGSGSTLAGAGAGGEAKSARTLPQYVAIAAELRKLMATKSIPDIVPSVKTMKHELAQHRNILDQMQEMLATLCTTLVAGSSEASLVKEMQALASSSIGGNLDKLVV